jgi:hypothetical protein
MKKSKHYITKEEMLNVIERIMDEEETRAKYNGKESQGMTLEEIANKVAQRLGNDWVVKG